MLPRRVTAHRRSVLELDALCRRVVMTRAGAAEVQNGRVTSWWGACEWCRKQTWLQWSHFYSRAIHGTRWDLDNSHAICAGCHFTRAHHRPAAFDTWMRERLGRARYDALALRAHSGNRRPDHAAVRLFIITELARLTEGAGATTRGK